MNWCWKEYRKIDRNIVTYQDRSLIIMGLLTTKVISYWMIQMSCDITNYIYQIPLKVFPSNKWNNFWLIPYLEWWGGHLFNLVNGQWTIYRKQKWITKITRYFLWITHPILMWNFKLILKSIQLKPWYILFFPS